MLKTRRRKPKTTQEGGIKNRGRPPAESIKMYVKNPPDDAFKFNPPLKEIKIVHPGPQIFGFGNTIETSCVTLAS